MCITGQIPDPDTPGVWWRDDTAWRRYHDVHADVIGEGIKSGEQSVELRGLYNGRTYTVDLRIMQQRSPRGFMRPVLIVGGAGADEGPGEVQVLYDLVESFRSSAEVEDFVAQNAKDGLELVSQRPNPYLHHTSALYDTFLETLVLHLPDLKGLIVCESGRKKQKTASPLEHVFHGTRPHNIDSIVQSGMEPQLRLYGYDYFTTDPRLSLRYTAKPPDYRLAGARNTTRRLLVFLVLKLPPGLHLVHERGGSEIFVMQKVEYELPIAEVTVRIGNGVPVS